MIKNKKIIFNVNNLKKCLVFVYLKKYTKILENTPNAPI